MIINIDEYWLVFNLIIHVDGSVEIVFTRQKLSKLPDMRRRATQLVKSIETMIYRGYWKSVRYTYSPSCVVYPCPHAKGIC